MPSANAGYAPDIEKYLKSVKGQPLELSIENLVSLLKRRQIKGAEPCAVATAHILLQVVAKSKWHDVESLLKNVTSVGRKLVDARPSELVIGNIVRRVLGLIRDEAAEDRNDSGETPSEGQMTPILPSHTPNWPTTTTDNNSDTPGTPRPGLHSSQSFVNPPKTLFHLLSASPPLESGTTTPFGNSGTSTPLPKTTTNSTVYALRSEVIDGIEEIKDEISQVDDQIAAQAEVQINPGDYVLVHEPSPTVQRFILRAALKRKFTVFIAVDRPSQTDEVPYAAFRKKLSAAGVEAINLMQTGLMVYMSRVNKVILGARAIMANGSIVGNASAATIAEAAKEYGNPVIVLGGIYKLSPGSPFDEDNVIEYADPSTVVDFSDGPFVKNITVLAVEVEVVPARLIDTYITNLGTHSYNHLSNLISDHYKPEDLNFHVRIEDGQ